MKLLDIHLGSLTLLIVILIQVVVFGEDRVLFPGSGSLLPNPEPCDKNEYVCGDDENRYPSKDILNLVEESVALTQSEQTRAKFFPEPQDSPIVVRSGSIANDDLRACASRTETVPRYARAKNIEGNWKYLVQRPNGDVQQVEITVCANPNAVCLNSLDSPDGPNSVTCRQLYRNQKLLAVNASGLVEVDTFQLPSACVCNHQLDHFVRSGLPSAPNVPNGPDGQECNKISDLLDDRTARRAVQRPARLVIVRTPFQKHLAKLAARRRNVFQIQRLTGNSKVKTIRSPDEEGRFEFSNGDASSDGLSFPDYLVETPEDYQESATVQELETLNPLPCRDGLIICEEDPDYPTDLVRQSLARNNLLRLAGFFEKIFNGACEKISESDLDLRTRSFNLGEEPLCRSTLKYIFPKKAENMEGKTVIIINTDEYQQGVTVAECLSYVQGKYQ
ncbi:uncharacterized protein LOC131893375 [Tigriopus californicus]|uniref:uncharacterized protein LOC131893375 n=1 Tax=Tigriopus californicus TaxID=6832 RepID=UPI0027DAB0C4|nr:uncharacterized protein LOC131893375 [Tigriopus californicus]